MAAHVLAATAAQVTLRPLSPFERLFWAFEQVNGFNFSIALTFKGTVERTRWNSAFGAVQKRHPMLQASLNLDDPNRPVLVRAANRPIPVEFRRRSFAGDWQRVMEQGYMKPFDVATGPFLRAVVLEDEAGCDLVLTAFHAVLDGMGVLGLVGELLRALAGEKLLPMPMPVSTDERTAEMRRRLGPAKETPQADENMMKTVEALKERAIGRHKGSKAATVTAHKLAPEQTARLVERCRKEKVTVGTVLLAAQAAALRKTAKALEKADIRLSTPVNTRSYVENKNDCVMSVISARAVCRYPAKDLWKSARAIRAQLLEFQSLVEIEAAFARTHAVMEKNMEPTKLLDAFAPRIGHDAMVSNLRNVEFETLPSELKVEAVWGPTVLVGFTGEHEIGLTTVNGALHMVYTSRYPAAGLLEAIERELDAACL
jgi:hypothetical protein